MEGLPEGFRLSTLNVNFNHQRPVMSSFEILDQISEAIDWFRPGRRVSYSNDRPAAVAGVLSVIRNNRWTVFHPRERVQNKHRPVSGCSGRD